MHKSDRLFQLTNILRLRQPVTARDLADELHVSVRTIYRYIDDLSASGVPVFGEPGVGYRLDKNFSLPPLNLSTDELDALLIGMKMVCGWTGTELPQAARSLLQKIEAVLPEYRRSTDPGLFQVPVMYFESEFREKHARCWDRLRHAIRQRRITSIDYRDAQQEFTQRWIYPLGLFYWGGKWTLGAWCTLRGDYRNFRTDRIEAIAVSKEQFTTDDRINLRAYIRQQLEQACDPPQN